MQAQAKGAKAMPHKTETAAFGAFRGLSAARQASNRAFMVEALLLIAFLAASVAIILQLFAAAGVHSQEAHRLSMSEHLATNAAESFGASPTTVERMTYYDADGNKVNTSDVRAYSVQTTITSQHTAAGVMYNASIVVANHEQNYDGDVTYELQTQRYLSNSEGGERA